MGEHLQLHDHLTQSGQSLLQRVERLDGVARSDAGAHSTIPLRARCARETSNVALTSCSVTSFFPEPEPEAMIPPVDLGLPSTAFIPDKAPVGT